MRKGNAPVKRSGGDEDNIERPVCSRNCKFAGKREGGRCEARMLNVHKVPKHNILVVIS